MTFDCSKFSSSIYIILIVDSMILIAFWHDERDKAIVKIQTHSLAGSQNTLYAYPNEDLTCLKNSHLKRTISLINI